MKVTIVRRGGFAGLTRQWSASIDPAEPQWHALLDRLPWDEVDRDARGPDRFIYLVTCEPRSAGTPERRREIPEHRFTGPWQELFERVRDMDDD